MHIRVRNILHEGGAFYRRTTLLFINIAHLFRVSMLLSVAIFESGKLIKTLLHASIFLALEFFNLLIEVITILHVGDDINWGNSMGEACFCLHMKRG